MGNTPVGGPHQPANTYQTQQVDASKSQAKVGEHSVSASHSSRLSDGVHSLSHKISSFFEGISNKISNWSAHRSEAIQHKRESKAEVAAQEFFTNLNDGNLSAAYDNLVKIHNAAHGQKTDNPQQVIGEYLKDGAAKLSPEVRHALHGRDFGNESNRLVNGHLRASSNAIGELEGLARSGLASPEDVRQKINFVEDMKREIPAALGMVSDAVSAGAATNVRETAKGVFDVAENGQINTLRDDVKIMVDKKPVAGEQVLKDTANTLLNGKQDDSAGVSISSSAAADFNRLNINFHKADGTAHNTYLEGSTDRAAENFQQSVAALRETAGSDEATKVLSSVLNQSVALRLMNRFEGEGGKEVTMHAAGKGYDGAVLHGADGDRSIEDPGAQIAGAKFDLTKTETGDFNVHIKWEQFAVGVRDIDNLSDTVLMHPENPRRSASNTEGSGTTIPSVLSVTLDVDMTISAEAAAQGKLEFIDTSVKHQFEGRVMA